MIDNNFIPIGSTPPPPKQQLQNETSSNQNPNSAKESSPQGSQIYYLGPFSHPKTVSNIDNPNTRVCGTRIGATRGGLMGAAKYLCEKDDNNSLPKTPLF